MKKAAKEQGQERKVMTYRNNNKRVIKLADLGLIKEIKPDVHNINIHGRKDYKVTTKGLKHLAYGVTHPDDVKLVYEYMDRFGLNKQAFGDPLVNRTASMIKSADRYLKSIRNLDPLPVDPDQFTSLLRSKAELDITLQIIQRAKLARSKRQMLAPHRVVGSTIKTEHNKSETGRDQEFTTIIPSKDLVDFERQQQLQQHLQQQQQKSSTSGGISQPKKSKSMTPLQKKGR